MSEPCFCCLVIQCANAKRGNERQTPTSSRPLWSRSHTNGSGSHTTIGGTDERRLQLLELTGYLLLPATIGKGDNKTSWRFQKIGSSLLNRCTPCRRSVWSGVFLLANHTLELSKYNPDKARPKQTRKSGRLRQRDVDVLPGQMPVRGSRDAPARYLYLWPDAPEEARVSDKHERRKLPWSNAALSRNPEQETSEVGVHVTRAAGDVTQHSAWLQNTDTRRSGQRARDEGERVRRAECAHGGGHARERSRQRRV